MGAFKYNSAFRCRPANEGEKGGKMASHLLPAEPAHAVTITADSMKKTGQTIRSIQSIPINGSSSKFAPPPLRIKSFRKLPTRRANCRLWQHQFHFFLFPFYLVLFLFSTPLSLWTSESLWFHLRIGIFPNWYFRYDFIKFISFNTELKITFF